LSLFPPAASAIRRLGGNYPHHGVKEARHPKRRGSPIMDPLEVTWAGFSGLDRKRVAFIRDGFGKI
jgi:hypothetical protein